MPPTPHSSASQAEAIAQSYHVIQVSKPHDPALGGPGEPSIEIVQDDEPFEDAEKPDLESVKVAQAKFRHDADLKKHIWEDSKPDKPGDDWQVAYVWAFITKFGQKERIRKLECLSDFERCLMEPVANRPDDIFEGVLIRFLSNLRPGLRTLDCTNIQHHLSNYIADALLKDADFTVWDRLWAPNEEARGPCCSSSANRHELGRLRYVGEPLQDRVSKNPIMQQEEKGGGLFELDWHERAKLLRQMVDWQIAYAETIKDTINQSRGKHAAKGPDAESLNIAPLGLDRNKQRIWVVDDSTRVYRSGNPFKRPCALLTISNNREELQTLIERFSSRDSNPPPKVKGSGPKGKPTAAETAAHRKLLKGVGDEKQVAERLTELLPAIEKEDARVQRARKRISAAVDMAQAAESRATRTRRSSRKVDYTYDGLEEDSDEGPSKRSRRDRDIDGANGSDLSSRPVIPGERQSARVRRRGDALDIDSIPADTALTSTAQHTDNQTPSTDVPSSAMSNGDGHKRSKNMRGYAWVDEYVPYGQLTPKEQQGFVLARQASPEKVSGGDFEQTSMDKGGVGSGVAG